MRTAIMQKCGCADHPFRDLVKRYPARVLCSGKTSAFQADDTGSIPVTRFSERKVRCHLFGEQQHQAAAGEFHGCSFAQWQLRGQVLAGGESRVDDPSPG